LIEKKKSIEIIEVNENEIDRILNKARWNKKRISKWRNNFMANFT
jgi:hypothetical protein